MTCFTSSNARRSLLVPLAASLCLVATTACVGIGGESIPVTYNELRPPQQMVSERIRLREPATDERSDQSRIGRATITVFAITSGSIKTEDRLVKAVIDPVESALATAGYSVERVEEKWGRGNDAGPTVVIEVEDFYFRNYNWLWPIVPTWGGVELGLELRGADEEVLYSQSFKSSGKSFCLQGHCAFKAATRRAMNGVLEQIIEATASTDFQVALRQASESSLADATRTESEAAGSF